MSTRPILLLVAALLLLACSPLATPSDSPTPADDLAIGFVRLTVINETGIDLSDLTLSYDDEQRTIAALAAGAQSEALTFPWAYQAPDSISATDAEGNPLGYSNLDGREMTGETPITGGDYDLTLGLYDGELGMQELIPNSDSVLPLLQPLLNALSASHEPRVQRGTPFDQLAGEVVARQEGLTLQDYARVDAFLFEDEASAGRFAQTIQPGGTTLYDPSGESATTVSIVESFTTNAHWWQNGAMLLSYRGSDAEIIQAVSDVVGSEPLALENRAGELSLRIYNLSDQPFSAVTVQSGGGSATFGTIPPYSTSGYLPIDELYRYGSITVERDGERVETMAIDYVGETPLPPGRYSYVLELGEGGELMQMVLADDAAPQVDEQLLNTVWEWTRATDLSDGSNFTPAGVDGAPTLTFTADSNPNAGEEGLIAGAYLGCNSGGASYLLNQFNQILFLGGAQTEMWCEDEGAMESEQRLADALHGIAAYRVDGDSLTLVAGESELTFTAQAPSEDPLADLYAAFFRDWNGDDVAFVEVNAFEMDGTSAATLRDRFERTAMGQAIDVDPALWEALTTANAAAAPPAAPASVARIAPDAAQALRSDGAGWATFHYAYPNLNSLFSCSQAGIDGDQALLYCNRYSAEGPQSFLSHFLLTQGRWLSDWSTAME